MISRTVKTSLLWKTRFSKILETCYTGWWQLGKCARENKCTHGRFTCFISSEMFENEKHITVWNWKNISQLIFCRLFTDLYAISQQIFYYSKLQNITKRKLQIEILILTLFTAFTTDGKFPMGKLLELGLSLMRKLKFPSELPGCIAVLLAV